MKSESFHPPDIPVDIYIPYDTIDVGCGFILVKSSNSISQSTCDGNTIGINSLIISSEGVVAGIYRYGWVKGCTTPNGICVGESVFGISPFKTKLEAEFIPKERRSKIQVSRKTFGIVGFQYTLLIVSTGRHTER